MTFPQLKTGALAQYPVRRRSAKRTVITTAADGSVVRFADDNAATVEWTLQYEGLSSDEWKALESCFQAAEGQLETFTFVDPLGNMLAWSTDLTQSVWQRGPGLAATGGMTDPFRGNQACRLVNEAQAPQDISQSVAAPGTYQYTFSIYGCAPTPETIALTVQSGAAISRLSVPLSGQWTRLVAMAQLSSCSNLVIFGVELEAGATVMLAAPQAEAQPSAGVYLPSFSMGAVYPKTRFLDDGLEMTSSAPDQYSSVVKLRSAGA
jgi:hypothetical protein